jgi:hypothetical protein
MFGSKTLEAMLDSKKIGYIGKKIHFFLTRGPIYHYYYARWRLRWFTQKLGLFPRLPYPDNVSLLKQLDLTSLVRTNGRNKSDVDSQSSNMSKLAPYFKSRKEPIFFFTASDIQDTLSQIDDQQKRTTIRTANEICQNIFRFRRQKPVQFESKIDWSYCPQGNIDWNWDLNRHTYFETLGRAYHYTGAEEYAEKFRELMLDWIAHNPIDPVQSSWASVLEAAARINTWIWAYYYFRKSDAFDPETCLALLRSLLVHGQYVDVNLELHVPNNHLLLEAKALAMLGLLFPEFKPADQWRQRGLSIVDQQIEAQVCADGVHGERTTHYHRVITSELLELFTLMENNGVPIKSNTLEAFQKMIEFELWITKPDGQIPLLGDSASEDTYSRFSALQGGPALLNRTDLYSIAPPLGEATIWLLGAERTRKRQAGSSNSPTKTLGSRAFPEGGYYIMRQGTNVSTPYMVFDCGPFGYKPAPSHGHADALSFELYANGQTLLVDPGVYSTQLGQDWRNFFRSTRAHNTVVVDGQDQSTLLDIWRVYRPAQTTLHQWISSADFDFVDGSHDGYERLPRPVNHRRQIFFAKPEYWIIIDLLTGQGHHRFDWYFHTIPGTNAEYAQQTGAWHIERSDTSGLVILPVTKGETKAELITGASEPIQGWTSLFSGEKQPAPALRCRQEAVVPLEFITILYPHPADHAPVVTASPLNVKKEKDALGKEKLTGLRVLVNDYIDYLILDRTPVPAFKSFGDYQTDARLAYVRHSTQKDSPQKAILQGGNSLLFQEETLLSNSVPNSYTSLVWKE